MSHPILYSFRRCPYAMRARMALVFYQQQVIVREISLKDKPLQLLEVSPKGTVPVLVLPNGEVIDESLDIMLWVAAKHDDSQQALSSNPLVKENDSIFATNLKHYKYFERYPEKTQGDYFNQCLVFLTKLDNVLNEKPFLAGHAPSLFDLAIFPLVRQCRKVDEQRFANTSLVGLKRWTNHWLNSDCLAQAMTKYPRWDMRGSDVNYLF